MYQFAAVGRLRWRFKKIEGLYSVGQFNGSSGYEEAAVQGFMAGVNAAMKVMGRKQVVLDRSQAYIGVLIDDLVTKENHKPYRMMTSRAGYRLLCARTMRISVCVESGMKSGW